MKPVVTVWPGGEAAARHMAAETSGSPEGIVWEPPVYTLNNFLPLVLDSLPVLSQERRLLSPLAGLILVQELLARPGRSGDHPYTGLAAGWRFPSRLWRLLVEVKAAGLEPEDLGEEASRSPRVRALGELLADYNRTLAERSLADQADGLAHLESEIQAGRTPERVKAWGGVEVRQALWLRTLDIRLLQALGRVVPVTVGFCLMPGRESLPAVYGLLEKTLRLVEGDREERLIPQWTSGVDGPLAGLARAALDPSLDYAPSAGAPPLRLVEASGRYAEVEALLETALDLVEGGTAPHEVAVAFPDLAVYGQMARDVARRLGLPLSGGDAPSLSGVPLAADFLELVRLPAGDMPRENLARIWESPYLAPALCRALAVRRPHGVGRLLIQAGYVDAREETPQDCLKRAARLDPPRMAELALTLEKTLAWMRRWDLNKPNNLLEYSLQVSELASLLPVIECLARPGAGAPAVPPSLLVREIMTWREILAALDDLVEAAGQTGAGTAFSPGRLWALLREALNGRSAPGSRGAVGGVRLLRLDQAQGLEVDHLLVGGLSQNSFPTRPSGRNLLTSAERRSLGEKAQSRIPVWRTDEEEYGGQMLRLVSLLGRARQGAVLTWSASDASGGRAEPSYLIGRLRDCLGTDYQPETRGRGVFGQIPSLGRCRDESALWGGLGRALLRPGRDKAEVELAQAGLYHLCRDREKALLWRELAGKARDEELRASLEQVNPEDRPGLAGPYAGRVVSPPALELLSRILDQPKARKLSATSLESYAACPMAWFFQRMLGLGLVEEPGWALDRRGEGNWVHKTLELFFRPSHYDPSWDEARRAAVLEECLDRAARELREGGQAGHRFVWESRRAHLLRALTRVVEGECRALGREARPFRVEAPLGNGPEEGLVIPLENARPLVIAGRMDRLDLAGEDLWVTDYKHTSDTGRLTGPLKREEWGKTAFQIPLYLLAASGLAGHRKAGLKARVVPTFLASQTVKELELEPGDAFLATDQLTRLRLAKDGGDNLLNSVEKLWKGIGGGFFVPTPENADCRVCPHSRACRANPSLGWEEKE